MSVQMSSMRILALLGALLLSACAIAPAPVEVPPSNAASNLNASSAVNAANGPKISRLSADELARLSNVPQPISLNDLVAMAKSGSSSAAIINRFRASGASFELTPAQTIDLHAQGLPIAVLQVIYEEAQRALHNRYAQQVVNQEQQCAIEAQRAQKQCELYTDPYRMGYYGGWGGGAWGNGVYRGGGMYMGW